jgi:hypothetical protein
VARYCIACAHEDGQVIDNLLRTGTPVQVIVSKYRNTDSPLSISGLRRHASNHLPTRSLLREQRLSAELSSIDLLDHLAEALADLAAVRSNALQVGAPGLLLRSADTTSRLVAQLLSLLGDGGDLETVRLLKEGQTLAQSVGALIRANPEFGGLLAQELDNRDAPDIAAEARAVAVESANAASAASSSPIPGGTT